MKFSDLESLVDSTNYHRFDEGLTVCLLKLKNGFLVSAESDLKDPETAERASYAGAVSKMWALEKYRIASEVTKS